MDHPVEDATTDSIFGNLSAEEFYMKHQVEHRDEFMENLRGMKIFTQSWKPVVSKVKALVLVLHGFTVDSSWMVQLTAVGIAKRGFFVHALDYQGHGRSEGRIAHIPDFNAVADDCIQFFDSVKQKHPSFPAFMYAESLGAAIALLIHFRQPKGFDGVVLHGAMCGLNWRFSPPWPVDHLLGIAASIIPSWKICPTPDNAAVSFKEPWKLKLVKNSPYKRAARADAATGYESLRLVKELKSRMHEVVLPFLAVHGEDDRICDPEAVICLYERARSEDKTLKMYKGMWHMFVGEPKEETRLVFSEIITWLEGRADRAAMANNKTLFHTKA